MKTMMQAAGGAVVLVALLLPPAKIVVAQTVLPRAKTCVSVEHYETFTTESLENNWVHFRITNRCPETVNFLWSDPGERRTSNSRWIGPGRTTQITLHVPKGSSLSWSRCAEYKETKHNDIVGLRCRGSTDTRAALAAPAKADPQSAEEALGLTSEQRRKIQKILAGLGFNPGLADGIFGRGTRGAISGWQDESGDEATGYLTAGQSKTLLAGGGAGESEQVSEAKEGNWGLVWSGGWSACTESPEGALSWAGKCAGGKPTGKGVVSHTNGSVYEGAFVDGKQEGRWVLRYADGGASEGSYVDGKREGRWVVRYADGIVGEGEYDDNVEQHGLWSFRHPDGSTFEIRFRNGLIVE